MISFRSLLAMGACSIAAASLAQSSFNVTSSGKGEYDLSGSRTRTISRVTAQFYRDGRFRIFLNGEDQESLAGTYDTTASRRYRLNIDSAFDHGQSSGRGNLELGSGNQIDLLSITGYTSGRSFKVTFRDSNSWDDQNSGSFGGSGGSWNTGGFGSSNSGNVNGRGSVTFKGKTQRFTSLQGSFNGDNVRLVLRGDTTITLDGENEGNNRFTLRRLNNKSASGSGVVNNITNSKAVISLTGRLDGDRFSISFNGTSGGSGGSWDNNNNWGGNQGSNWSSNTFGPKTFRGDGEMSYNGKRDDLNTSTVTIYRNGRFSVNFSGEARPTFEGRWSKSGSNDYSLTVDRVSGENSSGTGRVNRNSDGDVTSISFSVRYKGDRLTLNFRS